MKTQLDGANNVNLSALTHHLKPEGEESLFKAAQDLVVKLFDYFNINDFVILLYFE